MRFFKNNSYDIVKLFINQIGISIFSMMLYSSISLIDLQGYRTPLYVVISVFSVVFYFALLYTATWEFGAKDKIRIDGGKSIDGIKEGKMPLKGVLLGLYANIPNFIVVGSAVILETVHLLGGAEGFYSAYVLLNNMFRLGMSMYLGILQGIFFGVSDAIISSFYQAIGFLVAPFFAIGACQLGYSLGYREFRISSLLGANDNKNNKKK